MSTTAEPADRAAAALQRRRQLRGRATDRILARAKHLAPGDRALVEQVYDQGQQLTTLARLSGVPAHRLYRRLCRVLRRMRDPLFEFVATRGTLLPREVAATAERVVLQGQSLRQAARSTGQSLYRVRQHMQTVRAYHRLTGM
jgi:DNA-directed RNA polymerase specialized sigma24 family protein